MKAKKRKNRVKLTAGEKLFLAANLLSPDKLKKYKRIVRDAEKGKNNETVL